MKRSRIIKIILFGLLLLGSVFCYNLFEENREQSQLISEYQKAVDKPLSEQVPKVIYISKKDSTTHIQKEVIQSKEISNAISKEYHSYVSDTLAPALKIATERIDELIRIKAKLEGELKATKIELAENKSQRIYYENKYLSIITHTDSLGNPQDLKYTYNAEINVAHFSQRKNFWSKERNYIDVSSPDKNFKINGLENYKKEIYIRPKNVGLGVQLGYGMDRNGDFLPYVGLGVSWNLIKF